MTRTRAIPQALLALALAAALVLPAAAAVCPPMESNEMAGMVCPLMAAGACGTDDAETDAPFRNLSRSVPDCCSMAELPTPDRTVTAPAPNPSPAAVDTVAKTSYGIPLDETETATEPLARPSPTPLFTLHQAFLI